MNGINYFLICETVLNDSTGRPSLINIFDSFSTTLPTHLYKISFALSVSAGFLLQHADKKKEVVMRIEVTDPSGELISAFKQAVPTDFLKEYADNSITSHLDLSETNGMDITQAGEYIAVLRINNEVVASKSLLITELEEEKEEEE
jgi:hypothetical protein